MKVILFSVVLILLGIIVAYFANVLTGKDINMPLLYTAIGLISAGVLVLIYAFVTKKNELTQKDDAQANDVPVEVIKSKSLIERNNQIVSEWSKTGETRDRLKLLEGTARIEEDPNK